MCVGGAVWSRSHFSPTQAFYSSSLSNTPSPLGTCFSVIARFDSPPLFFHSTHRYPGCNGERKVSVILNARWCHCSFYLLTVKVQVLFYYTVVKKAMIFLWIILSFIFSRLFNSLQLVLCLSASFPLYLSLSLSLAFLSVSFFLIQWRNGVAQSGVVVSEDNLSLPSGGRSISHEDRLTGEIDI